MKLLQSQKNHVFKTIENRGLSPSNFHFKEAGLTTHLTLKNSSFYFTFGTNERGGHFATFSPGYDTIKEVHNAGDWGTQLNNVSSWLMYLKREMSAPDLWKLFEDEINSNSFDGINYDNSKFTIQEYKIIEAKIQELKLKIESLDLVEEQIKAINEKLDHLLVLAQDLNKTDWKELFIGAIISLTMQLSIDKETGHAIYGFMKGLFISLLPANI